MALWVHGLNSIVVLRKMLEFVFFMKTRHSFNKSFMIKIIISPCFLKCAVKCYSEVSTKRY